MTDPLSDRLSSFGDDGPAPLLPSSAVRARGARRRARGRALVGGAAAAVLLLGAGGGYALLAGTGETPQTLQQATAAPSPTPSAAPRPTATTAAPVDPDLLLDDDAAAGAVGGSWLVTGDRQDRYAPYPGCPGREVPAADAGVVRGLGGGGLAVVHTLLRYDDAATARVELDAFVVGLTDCPDRPLDSGDGTDRYRPLKLPGSRDLRVAAEVTTVPSCPGCRPVVTALSVTATGPYLSYVAVGSDDRADVDALVALTDAAQTRLAAAAPAPDRTRPAEPTPEPDPTPAAPSVVDLLLRVAEAEAAEPGSWAVTGLADEGPVLDPCPGGTRYPRDADRTGDASRELTSTREAGGTVVLQHVARYPSEAVAADAAAGYERAVVGCPSSPGRGPEGGTVTHEVLGSGEVAGVSTTYVRRVDTCDTCVLGHTYYAVQQHGDLVSVLLVEHGEDGDPGQDVVEPFARQAAGLLARAARG